MQECLCHARPGRGVAWPAAVRSAGATVAILSAVSYSSFRCKVARRRSANSRAKGQNWYRTSTSWPKFDCDLYLLRGGSAEIQVLSARAESVLRLGRSGGENSRRESQKRRIKDRTAAKTAGM